MVKSGCDQLEGKVQLIQQGGGRERSAQVMQSLVDTTNLKSHQSHKEEDSSRNLVI